MIPIYNECYNIGISTDNVLFLDNNDNPFEYTNFQLDKKLNYCKLGYGLYSQLTTEQKYKLVHKSKYSDNCANYLKS